MGQHPEEAVSLWSFAIQIFEESLHHTELAFKHKTSNKYRKVHH